MPVLYENIQNVCPIVGAQEQPHEAIHMHGVQSPVRIAVCGTSAYGKPQTTQPQSQAHLRNLRRKICTPVRTERPHEGAAQECSIRYCRCECIRTMKCRLKYPKKACSFFFYWILRFVRIQANNAKKTPAKRTKKVKQIKILEEDDDEERELEAAGQSILSDMVEQEVSVCAVRICFLSSRM